MFENFKKFFQGKRHAEITIAIVSVGIGILILNKMGLYEGLTTTNQKCCNKDGCSCNKTA
jgi:hypothetical protein